MFSVWTMLLLNTLCLPLRLGSGGSFPRPLKPEEEQMYLERCAQGDMEARNKLVEHNLRLVSHILKKYYVQPSDQDDLISIGTIGLIKGVSTYVPGKKVRLATYCSTCIQNAVCEGEIHPSRITPRLQLVCGIGNERKTCRIKAFRQLSALFYHGRSLSESCI